MRLDLHLHSTASDGALAPAELVARARKGGLDVIALTDHDTAAGVPEAVAAAADELRVIPAIEMSAEHSDRDLHILGYFRDVAAPVLVEYAEKARGAREERIRMMIDRLADLDVVVDFDAVIQEAGPGASSLARPHLARVLRASGHVESIAEAFDRFIGDQGPAFVGTRLLDTRAAIELIHAAAGIAVWAHPPADAIAVLLPQLVDMGLDGLEVYRPRLAQAEVDRLKRAARRYGLLATGGSDWHGDWHGELGSFHLGPAPLRDFLDRIG
jgi:3',5'-nucleoside bisphosphate phosphatase